MKQISSNVVRGLCQGSRCVCADNSGAKIVEIISVFRFTTRKRQKPSAGIASLVNVVVKAGKHSMRKKNGLRICFEYNAVVLVDKKGLPKASEVKGCVAKEVGERYAKIAGLASSVI